MSLYRKTAIVQFELPSGATAERLPLTTDRSFGVILTIDGQSLPAGYFYSPLNDDQWREFTRRLSDCNVRHSTDDTAYRNAMFIRDIGLSLYKGLSALNPQLQAFLDDQGVARRLVIQTTRPELHLLPWGALYAGGGKLLSAGDLSIVQSFDSFSASLAVTQSRLNLLRIAGTDTNLATAVALKLLPPEIVSIGENDPADPDILHVEAHGDRTTNQIGGVSATNFGDRYAKSTIALLWSCYSSAANSWGDSPALCLHQAGTAMVLSFQAELHVLDASSIAQGLYSDVFGAAASRNPESALVRLRTDKFANEFSFANWASMTVYMRRPLDLSVLPLNGPRVPKAQWVDNTQTAETPTTGATPTQATAPVASAASVDLFLEEATELANRPFSDAASDGGDGPEIGTAFATAAEQVTDAAAVSSDPWGNIAEAVRTLQPGSWKQMAEPPEMAVAGAKLPMKAFGGWRGNVIRLDGCGDSLSRNLLSELDLQRYNPPAGDAAERLVWFFEKIAHYGSPLIVWTNSLPRHMEFLNTIGPSPALTFLLLTGPEPETTIPLLVDLNRLDDARKACGSLDLSDPTKLNDETLSAAYYACVRGMNPDLAKPYLTQIKSFQEWLLLVGNLFSRDKKNVLGTQDLLALGGRFISADNGISSTDFEQLHRPEDFYRLAINLPADLSSPRETARAKHELAYLMQSQGRPGTAAVFYRLALNDLESCDDQSDGTRHDSRWYFAISAVLRDLADLLSSKKEFVPEATELLNRAMAIQSFHGMQLQLGYSETTAAKLALTGSHHSHAINHAVNAANRMEACANWSGWSEALGILFDSLSETRESARMINLANLANEKIRQSNLSPTNIAKQERLFKFEKAKAHWIAGDVVEARDEFEEIKSDASEEEKSDMDREIDRLLTFLRVTRPPQEEHRARRGSHSV